MQSFWQDARYGARMLVKSPTFTVVAIIALALGIGANTAIFSVVNAVLVQPLPYKEADRLMVVWEHNFKRGKDQNVISPANFLDWKDQNSVFEDLAGFFDQTGNLVGDREPEQLATQYVTPNFFSVLGVQAVLGRTLSPDDGKPDTPNLVLLGYGLWQRRFGGDKNIVGRTVNINRRDFTVIGVMPANFKWFFKNGSLTGKAPDAWMPFVLTDAYRVRQGRFMMAVGRLKPGVTVPQAQAEMTSIGKHLEEQYNDFNANWGVNVVPLRIQLSGEIRTALFILLGAVGFVLLIACANVANLMLSRATARQKEVAIRTALGAGRWRIIRQLVTESLLLSVVGGAVGLGLAIWGTEWLISVSPPNLLEAKTVKIDALVLAFTLGISLLTGILFGLLPAFEVSRTNVNEILKEGGRSAGGLARSHRLRNFFVMAEVALALVLLIGAGLLVKSLARLQSVNPGFNPNNVLTMRVQLPGAKYPQDRQRVDFFKQAVERLQALPGVQSASAVSFLPFAMPHSGTDFYIEGQPKPAAGQEPICGVNVVDANYFNTMQIPLKQGRLFNEQEATEMRHVVIVSDALVQRYFPGENPLGKRITIDMKDENVPSEIIGVIGEVKHAGLDSEVDPMVYWPHPELTYNAMTFVVRTQSDAASLAPAARGVITDLDSEQPVADVRTMESWIGTSLMRARFSMLLLSIFSAVAMILAAVGIYGVMAYSVAQRTSEIGIRMALGAQSGDVVKMILKHGMALTLAGGGIGLIAAFFLTRLLSTLLYEISATDPVTFVLLPVLLTGVALVACFIPAYRASRTDPMTALRYE